MWLIDQLYHGSSFYNIPGAFHLQGLLDIQALQQSLNKIMERHEAWRTSFMMVDKQPMQVVAPKLTWELPVIDLESSASESWQTEVQKLATEEAQKLFDLAKAPLVRAKLLRRSEEEHIFLLTMHHTVTDGWSVGVFQQELAKLYGAFANNQPVVLPELPIQYGDFALWQRDYLQGKPLEKQLNYWKQQLGGELPVLQLPTDYLRPTVATFTGAKEYFTFSPTLTTALNKLAQQEEVTLFMLLLAAFNVLLYRYTKQEDILIGSPIANRNRSELEGLLGLFVNTLVLRNNLSGDPSFDELLKGVREVTLDAYAHQDLPFEKLVEELQPERDLSRNPLFQVMFVLQNTPMTSHEVSGLNISTLEIESNTAQFDIYLSLVPSPQGLTGFLEYSTDLFTSETITRLIGNLQTLLESIVANPQQRISELPILTTQEQEQLLVTWNDTGSNYPQNISLQELFEQQVERSPDAIALIDSSQQLTYSQLNQQVNQLSHYLQKLGVTSETIVAICLERSLAMVIGILAILKAGGAYVPLDPSYPEERLNFIMADSQASILLTAAGSADKLSISSVKFINWETCQEAIATESQANPNTTSTGENLAYIIYTSGSTGKPKGVLGTHRGIVNGLHWFWKTYPFAPGEICCQKTAISFVDSIWEIFAPLLQGFPTVIIPQTTVQDPQLFIQTLAEQKISRVILVPSLLKPLVNNYGHLTKNLSQLKLWITSGEAVSLELVKTFQALLPSAKLINLYGSSEVSANVTCYDTSLLPEKPTSVPIGRPLDNTQAYILDHHLQPTPMGVVGDLYIGGSGLAKGYWNRPELSHNTFINNPFIPGSKLYKTGDLGRCLNDGNLEYLGRRDEQIKIRGFRIELGEIQAALTQHIAIKEAVVVADKEGDNQRLIAYLVTDEPDLVSQLNHYLSKKLPNYMLPAAFVVLESIPLTPNGKVDKKSLPKDKLLQPQSNQTFTAPRNFTELALAKMWQNLLQISQVGVTDNFFELGGYSLLGVRLMAQIHERFGHNLPLSTLFENPTIAQLAELVSQPSNLGSGSPLVPLQSSGSQKPFFCVHAAGGAIHNYINLARQLGPEQPFYALEQTPDQLESETITIEETATTYLKEIRAVQPEGPYLLGGWCYGGLVAFEMAQQLLQQGQKVDLLVVIDAILPETTVQPSKYDDAKFMLRLGESLKNWFGVDLSVSYEEIHNLSLQEQFNLFNKKANFVVSDAEMEQHLWSYQLFKAHIQAMRDYKPQVYPQEMILFRAAEQIKHDFESLEFSSSDPLLGWGKYSTQPIRVIEVSGNHFSMFNEPNILNLTKKLQYFLSWGKTSGAM